MPLLTTLATPLSVVTAIALGASPWLPADVENSAPCHAVSVHFADPHHGFVACSNGQLLLSIDSGLHWRATNSGLDSTLRAVFAVDGQTLFVAGRGVRRSVDAGRTWDEVGRLGDDERPVTAIAVAGGRLVAIQGSTLRHSSDGAQWDSAFDLPPSTVFHTLDVADDQIVHAAGGISGSLDQGTLLRSEDSGRRWRQLPFAHGRINAIRFVDGMDGVATTYLNGLFRTRDGGVTWASAGLETLDGHKSLLRHSADHWSVAITGSVLETRDGGQTWTSLYAGEDVITTMARQGHTAVAAGFNNRVLYRDALFDDSLE